MILNWLTIQQASDLIRRREISPVELVEACLAQIRRHEPQVNAFITLTQEQALIQAHQAEAEIQRGEIRSPLHGIPLALKDLYETSGIRTTAGSLFLTSYIPSADSSVVAKLSKAGVTLIGKLNMHEIALGVTNENPHYGVCRNPWDLERIPGGSSGGSGAALAAGFCLASLGSDTGGSIRIPASLCGIVGLKPTYGRVSLKGVIPLSWHLDHAGPMARTVRDTGLLLQQIAGYDPDDLYSIDMPVDDYTSEIEKGVRGWRVAVASGNSFQDIDEDVLSAVEEAAKVLSELGADVELIDIPDFAAAAQANSVLLTSDAAEFHKERLDNWTENFSMDIRERLQIGAAYTRSAYIQVRRTQAVFNRQMALLFSKFDILLLPTTPVPALPLKKGVAVERAKQLTRFTAPFNFTGLPAISLPCGFAIRDGRKLPFGLQMVARPWAEAKLLRAAHAYEQAAGWYLEHPEL